MRKGFFFASFSSIETLKYFEFFLYLIGLQKILSFSMQSIQNIPWPNFWDIFKHANPEIVFLKLRRRTGWFVKILKFSKQAIQALKHWTISI